MSPIAKKPVADDGVMFDCTGLEAAPIREEAEYGGVRVRTTATIAGARIPIQVDIGVGDAVAPAPVEIDFATLLEAPAPHPRAYPIETVVAGNFEAMVTPGIANIRLRDFYDLWLIAQTFDFRQSTLVDAVGRTFERRETALPAGAPLGLTDEFVAAWLAQWRAFLGRESLVALGRESLAAVPDSFAIVVADLRAFLLPQLGTPTAGASWARGGPWSTGVLDDE